MTSERDTAKSRVTELTTANGQLHTDKANLLAGLPAAVAAVPTGSLGTYLFSPIAGRPDVCGSYYVSGTYWSWTFDRQISGVAC